MKRTILFYLLCIILLSSCGGSNSNASHDDSSDNTIVEDVAEAYNNGYRKGYDDGYSDGYGWIQKYASYNDRNSYTTDDGISSYKNGYRRGYDEGYDEGESNIIAEREREKLNDWHNWDKEDVDGIYVEIDASNEDEAREIARRYYDDEYIEDGWDYYAKISLSWGTYNVTLGRRINTHLYQIAGTDKYIHFKWWPDVSSGDEGVLDWSGSFSEFYKKP